METSAQKKGHRTEAEPLSTSIIIPDRAPFSNVYKAHFSKNSYDKKPDKKDKKTFFEIQKHWVYSETETLSLVELLDKVNRGYAFKNGRYDLPPLTDNEQNEFREFRKEPDQHQLIADWQERRLQRLKTKDHILQETSLAVLDIDDLYGSTDPEEVMKLTGAIAIYYSYSHKKQAKIGTIMHRYRLFYDLSEPVTCEALLKEVQESMKQTILESYPSLHKGTYEGQSNGIDNLTNFLYGTKNGYLINENYKPIDVTPIKDELETAKAFDALARRRKKNHTQTTTENELLDMANHLGDTNGLLDHAEWTTLAIGLFNTAQEEGIPDETIIEILTTLDAGRNNEKYYLEFKRPIDPNAKRASVATFIKLATDEGFNRPFKQEPTKENEQDHTIDVTALKIEKYVDSTAFLDILENGYKKNLLISDTNTGKTFASVAASRRYLEKNPTAFVYIALPTTSLADQVALEYVTGPAIKGNMNVQKAVQTAIYDGSRLLVGTYDKAPIIYKYLQDKAVTIVIDECHKFLSDYSYRHKSINGLFALSTKENVINFIGMTGTADNLDKADFEYITKFELEKPKILADTLQFIEYHNATHYRQIVIDGILKEVADGNKVLAFINKKELIKEVAGTLRQKGLKVTTASAENQGKSNVYRKLLKTQKIDTDVVLSTQVLADGININNTKDYVCMIAPSHYLYAHFHNLDLIRQATNRFRNKYKKIVIPLFVKKEILIDEKHHRRSTALYNLDQQYNILLDHAEVTKTQIQTEFEGKMNLYQSSVAEHLAGLFNPIESDKFNFVRAYDNKARMIGNLSYDEKLQEQLDILETKFLTIDLRAIRTQASHDKDIYYTLYPYAFKRAISQVLDADTIQTVTAHEYFLQKDKEVEQILKDIDKLKIETDREKRDHLTDILHEIIFHKVKQQYQLSNRVNQSTYEWESLKEKMNPIQYKALTSLVKYLDYGDAVKELDRIENKNQVFELENQFKAVTELNNFTSTSENTVTKLIYNEILAVTQQRSYQRSELDDVLNGISKGFKIRGRHTIAKREKLFQDVFKRFFVRSGKQSQREGKKVITRAIFQPVTLDYMAEVRELDSKVIGAQYANFISYR